MSTLDGRVALVTGGARGIGRAISLRLARDGAAVAINYRSSETAAKEVVGEIEALGGTAIAVAADVAEVEGAAEAVEQTVGRLGAVDIAVNNAGISIDKLLYDMTADDWISVMHTNFGSVFNITKAAMPHMMENRRGSIVNISSVMGERGWVGQSNYSASKGAINAFTRASAIELARFGVRVNAVLPGFVATELVADLVERSGKSLRRQLPMRRFTPADDVAAAVSYLAGDDSAHTTGTCMTVDSGAAAQLGLGRAEW